MHASHDPVIMAPIRTPRAKQGPRASPRSRSLLRTLAALCAAALLVGSVNSSASATSTLAVGTSWQLGTGAPDNDWNSVAYGSGRFVAVSSDGTDRVMTSTDGRSWSTAGVTGVQANDWTSIAYGNNTFVAVAFDQSVMTSSNGLTWTTVAATGIPSQLGVEGITFGNGRFVAVGQQGTAANRAMTSTDGVNWTAGTIHGPSATWRSVTYGSGVFAATGFDSTTSDSVIITSPDGLSWASASAAVGINKFAWSITHGANRFVAVTAGQDNTSQVMTSTNASSWALAQSSQASQWRAIGYGDGLFVAAGKNAIMTSPDGTSWTTQNNPAANSQWRSLAYQSGIFVAVGDSGAGGTGNRVMYSGTLTPPQPPANPQTPVNNCVIKPRNVKWAGTTKIMKPRCKTTAGIPVKASANARTITTRGDLRYFKIFTKPSGTYLRTYGHRIKLTLTWKSRAIPTAPAYRSSKSYRIT